MTFWQVIESRKYNQNQKMIKSLEKFLNLESAFMRGFQNLTSCFFIEGGMQSNQKTGAKKIYAGGS